MVALDTAQLQALQTDITVTHAAETYEGKTLAQWWADGGDQEISEWYNFVAAPVVDIWRANITTREFGDVVSYDELLSLSGVDLQVYLLMIAGEPVDATRQSIRDGFAAILNGPQRATSRAAVIAMAMRPATYGEALFSSGPVDGAFISTIAGDPITRQNVSDARLV